MGVGSDILSLLEHYGADGLRNHGSRGNEKVVERVMTNERETQTRIESADRRGVTKFASGARLRAS